MVVGRQERKTFRGTSTSCNNIWGKKLSSSQFSPKYSLHDLPIYESFRLILVCKSIVGFSRDLTTLLFRLPYILIQRETRAKPWGVSTPPLTSTTSCPRCASPVVYFIAKRQSFTTECLWARTNESIVMITHKVIEILMIDCRLANWHVYDLFIYVFH